MTNSSSAALLEWDASPFAIAEQARTAFALAASTGSSGCVLTIDVTQLLAEPTPARICALGPDLAQRNADQLATLLDKRGVATRPIVMESAPRSVYDRRYRRSERPDSPGDLGSHFAAWIARDGNIDLKDAPLWLLPDWADSKMVYAVRPIATTFHMLADLLSPTTTPQAAFAKRMRFQEAALIACPVDQVALAQARLGASSERLIVLAPRQGATGSATSDFLVLTHSHGETETAVSVIDKLRRTGKAGAAVVAEALTGGLGVMTVRQISARGSNWIKRTTQTPLTIAKRLIDQAKFIAVLGDASPMAYAIAHWIDAGKTVSFQTPLPSSVFTRWPRGRPHALANSDGLIRSLLTDKERGQ